MKTHCAWCEPGTRGSHSICARHAALLLREAREFASEEAEAGGRVAIRFQKAMRSCVVRECRRPTVWSGAFVGVTRYYCDAHAQELVAKGFGPFERVALEARPERAFICPHCGYAQTRVWPKAADNYCNRCQKSMDAASEARDGEPLATPWDAPRGYVALERGRPETQGKRPEQVAYSALVLLGVLTAGLVFGVIVALSMWGSR